MNTADFIRTLFAFTDDQFGVYFATLPNERDDPAEKIGERHILTRDIEQLERFIVKWDRAGRGLFFCVATVKNKRNKANAQEITGAHTDVDFKSLDVTEEEVWAAIRKLRCPPTLIVRSGNGLHLYWLFHEPLKLTPDTTEQVEAVMRQLADHIGGDLAVCEVARLMRLPGTHNTKRGQWREVTVEQSDGPRYELNDLEEWLAEAAPVLRRRQPAAANAATGAAFLRSVPDNPFLAAAKLLGFHPPVDVEARLEAMSYGGAGDSSIHSTQLSVSASLLNAGREIDEVVGILLDATRAAAGEYGTRWNWRREEASLRKMCATWLTKHPSDKSTQVEFTLPPQSAVKLTADRGEEAEVVDLGEARAKRKKKPAQADVPLHILVAQATLGGMADRGEHVLFTEEGCWSCTGNLWTLQPDITPWLNRKLQECASEMGINANNRLISEARAYIIRSPDLYQPSAPWDGHGMVPTLSGLIDPGTGALTPATPWHYTTWRVPFAYDPSASCPLWLQMLEDTFADRDEATRAQVIQLLQELLGMGLIDRKPKALSLALVLVGGSDYGKSGLLDVMGGLFGPDCITAGIDTLEGTHALMPFAKRQPWILHEAFNQDKWHPSSTMKALVSGDPVQINMKGGKIFSRRFTGPILLGANSQAQFKEATNAIANRLAVIACSRLFDKKNPVGVEVLAQARGLAGASALVLADEMPGVLAWAVAGLRRARARGSFDMPAESMAAAREIVKDANIVARFVEEAVEFDRHTRLSVADCWAAFAMWWIRNKGDSRQGPPSRERMSRNLKALNDPRIAADYELRSSSTRYYAGIRLNGVGFKLWQDGKASEAFDMKGRLGDASQETPYDDIPSAWDTKPPILAMRRAHILRDASGDTGVSAPSEKCHPSPSEVSPVTLASPEASPTQPPEPPPKNRRPRF